MFARDFVGSWCVHVFLALDAVTLLFFWLVCSRYAIQTSSTTIACLVASCSTACTLLSVGWFWWCSTNSAFYTTYLVSVWLVFAGYTIQTRCTPLVGLMATFVASFAFCTVAHVGRATADSTEYAVYLFFCCLVCSRYAIQTSNTAIVCLVTSCGAFCTPLFVG